VVCSRQGHDAEPFYRACVKLDKSADEFGRASPGLLTQVRKHPNLGHPYGVATTSAAASIQCFVNLPRQVVCSFRMCR
jgi:hypothetical protein